MAINGDDHDALVDLIARFNAHEKYCSEREEQRRRDAASILNDLDEIRTTAVEVQRQAISRPEHDALAAQMNTIAKTQSALTGGSARTFAIIGGAAVVLSLLTFILLIATHLQDL